MQEGKKIEGSVEEKEGCYLVKYRISGGRLRSKWFGSLDRAVEFLKQGGSNE